MKKALIGGFFSLLGSIWALAMIVIAQDHLVSSWSTPPGRFVATLMEIDLMPIFVVSLLLVASGITIMGVELFRKE